MFNYIDPIAFLGITWYAIFILLGIVLAVYMGLREGKKLGIYSDFIYWGVIFCVPLSILGARLWYVLFNLDKFDSFLEVLGFTGHGFQLSGLAIQGGVIVAIVFVYFWSRAKNVKLYRVFDILAPGFLIGQILGRWGNFCNHELYGPIVENVSLFKKLLPSFITENMYISGYYRHPTFLYESLLNLTGLIIILVCRRKFKKMLSGDTIGFYLTWYGCVRIFTESLRLKGEPSDPMMLGPIPVSIAISILFIICGITFLVLKRFIGPKEYYQDILKQVENDKIDCVLFDLDGTLLNTQPLINASFIYTFSKYYPEHNLTDEELESFFGPPLKETFARYTSDENQINEMIEYYRAFNKANHDNYVSPFEGCAAVIKSLHKKGYKLGIVSSKKKEVVLMGTDLAKITNYFDVIITEDDVKVAKPSPEGILMAINKIYPDSSEGKRVMYVGDHPNDIKAAENAGILSCAAMYSKKSELLEEENPKYMIYSLNDVLKILNE
ncbi:MAG: prolipoprotein diacylglyceryl transferase [Anaeroplasmataceae bacterium]